MSCDLVGKVVQISASHLCFCGDLEEVNVFETAAPQGRGQTEAEETEILERKKTVSYPSRKDSNGLQSPPMQLDGGTVSKHALATGSSA